MGVFRPGDRQKEIISLIFQEQPKNNHKSLSQMKSPWFIYNNLYSIIFNMTVEGDEENAHFVGSFQMFNPLLLYPWNIYI